MLHAIAVIREFKRYGSIKGYRIYDTASDKYVDTSEQSVIKVLCRGTFIKNISLYNGEIDFCDIPGVYDSIPSINTELNNYTVLGYDAETRIYVCINSKGTKRYFTHEDITRVENEVFWNAMINKLNGTLSIMPPYDELVKGKVRNVRVPDNISKVNSKLDLLGNKDYRVKANGGLEVYNKDLAILKVPDVCKKVSANACKYNSSLRAVYLPDSVVEIGNSAFEYCQALTEVKMSNNIKKIGSNAFKSTKIVEMILPNGLKVIGDKAFNNCINLRVLSIPATVDSIGYNALYNLRTLERLVIPERILHGKLGLGTLPKTAVVELI